MFFKTCKIQKLMVIVVQVNELAIPINLVPKLLHQKEEEKLSLLRWPLLFVYSSQKWPASFSLLYGTGKSNSSNP